jgi:rare lipoprotein A
MMRRLALSLLAALLTACGTRPPAPVAPVSGEPTAPVARPAPPAKPPAYVLKKGGGYYQDDGPGENPPEDLDSVPDAQPRREPLHRFANRPYSVLGQDYVPHTELRPYKARGVGSWYGRKFHGQKTSSGEPYDMYAMTAAHPTLPIPSYARVSNPANGRSVTVRVNDRGPFHSGRIIDLSYTAAWKLGYVGNGSTLVEVESILPGIGAPTPAPAVAEEDPIARFAALPFPSAQAAELTEAPGSYVQLGAFGNPDNAEAFRNRLARELDWLGGRLRTTASGGMHRVQAGPFPSRGEAESIAERIQNALGFRPLVSSRGG